MNRKMEQKEIQDALLDIGRLLGLIESSSNEKLEPQFQHSKLADGRVMLVDDLGHSKGLPVNDAATELYHSVCRPGATWEIRGDVVIANDSDFE